MFDYVWTMLKDLFVPLLLIYSILVSMIAFGGYCG